MTVSKLLRWLFGWPKLAPAPIEPAAIPSALRDLAAQLRRSAELERRGFHARPRRSDAEMEALLFERCQSFRRIAEYEAIVRRLGLAKERGIEE